MSHINLGHTFFGDPAASAPKELTGRRGSQLSNGLELSVKGTFDDFENGVAHGGDIFHSRRKSRERYVCQYKIPTHISKWPNPSQRPPKAVRCNEGLNEAAGAAGFSMGAESASAIG